MKKIIDGKRYDTDTATRVCDLSPRGFYGSDYRREDTWLYRTRLGNWFMAGEGGPRSRWAQPYGQSGSTSGSGLRPLDKETARELLERYGDEDDVEMYFGASVEDA